MAARHPTLRRAVILNYCAAQPESHGVVEYVTPSGKSKYDSYLIETMYKTKMNEVTVKIEELHEIICTKYLTGYKDNGKPEILNTALFLWYSSIEVDQFRVEDCDEKNLKKIIKIITSVTHSNFGPFDGCMKAHAGVIVFKYSGRCHTRGYVIEVHDLFTTVERTEVTERDSDDCEDLKDRDNSLRNVVTSWRLPGKWFETNFRKDIPVNKLVIPDRSSNPCGENCWLDCKTHVGKDNTIKVIDIIINDQYMDRFKVNSCGVIGVSASIQFVEKKVQDNHATYTIIFMDHGGYCHQRQYSLQKTEIISPSAFQTVIEKSDSKIACPKEMEKRIFWRTVRRNLAHIPEISKTVICCLASCAPLRNN